MRLCTIDDCDRKHLAKGLCKLHYNQQNPNHRRMIDHPCDGCGTVIKKEASRLNRYPTLYCTPKCKTATQHRDLWLSRKAMVIYTPKPAMHSTIASYWQQQGVKQSRTFKAGNCRVCGSTCLTLYADVTCRDECSKEWHADRRREHKQRRRARERNAYRAPVSRTAIYARDNYTCQLCAQPIDMEARAPHPLSPSIDHVRPLARGGTHEPCNVQAAHFLCNALKSDQWATPAA